MKRKETQLLHYLMIFSVISIILLPLSALAYGEVYDFGKSRISVEIPGNFEPIEFDSNESKTRMRWVDDSTNSYLTIVSEYGKPVLSISISGHLKGQQITEKGTILEYDTLQFGLNYSGFRFILEGSPWPDPIFDVPVKEIVVFTQHNRVNYGIALISPMEDLKSVEANPRHFRFI